MQWKKLLKVTAISGLPLVVFVAGYVEASSIEVEENPIRPHHLGAAIALYHNRFIDDIISPVVYTSSTPLYELSYRHATDVQRHIVHVSFAFFTPRLKDANGEDEFNITFSDQYSNVYQRDLHRLDGTRVELDYEYLRQISTFENGRAILFWGGRLGIQSEKIRSTDHWYGNAAQETLKSWLSDVNLGMAGTLQYHLSARERLFVDLRFTLLASASRALYFYPVNTSTAHSIENADNEWMFPDEFLRWSVGISYQRWLSPAAGIAAGYRFQHQRVRDPRPLRYVSHALSLGVLIGF